MEDLSNGPSPSLVSALDSAGWEVSKRVPFEHYPAEDDESEGHSEWDYPHGFVTVTDSGTIDWGAWRFDSPERLREEPLPHCYPPPENPRSGRV